MAHSSGAFVQHVIYTLLEDAGQWGAVWKQLTENDCHEWKSNVHQSIYNKGKPSDQV